MFSLLRNYFYSKNDFKGPKGMRRSATIGVENFISAADGRTPLRARALRGANTKRLGDEIEKPRITQYNK